MEIIRQTISGKTEEKMKLSAQKLYKKGVSVADIAESLDISKKDVKQ